MTNDLLDLIRTLKLQELKLSLLTDKHQAHLGKEPSLQLRDERRRGIKSF